ncbi:RagB/SusD family nutrient uptake outer membrane protein [Pedobacter caeni]|uniref:SusD family protein n=1 Tax=Pedobacter caeni TaxID=288992 RepID=A0A1M5H3W7_9SPHI|nr:RagB/SusD family nutrient uptake outer membrane protein [Pedobacter caeni]SHG10687.1 SusD family protein [Pedobacter caeni]
MKSIKILLPVLLISLILASCKKFVDIKKISNQSFLTTANDCQLLLDNYDYMNTGYPLDGEVSADDYYVLSDSYKENVIPKIPLEEQDLYAWRPGAKRNLADPNWQKPYFVIYNANLVLETLAKINPATEDPGLLNTLKGSALFYRAYALWFVAQLYTKPYSASTADQDPGVPVRTSSDMNVESLRGTVKETYNSMIRDLSEALNLLPLTSNIPSRPNKVTVYAMLARLYLSMEDYPNALINSNEALKLKNDLLNYNGISAVSASPFSRFHKEVIFHSINYYKSTNPAVGAILYQGFAFNNIAKIAPDLVASYGTNDLRRTIFLKINSGIHAQSYRFTGNYEQAFSPAPTFFNGLATDEMYLISAECHARAGNIPEAAKALNTLLITRWKTGTYVDMSSTTPAEEALRKILEERRKELLMRGLRWTDLRRLNKDNRFKKDLVRKMIINGTETIIGSLPANDPRYTLLIPDEVIKNSGLAQNLR